jgi:endonuclease-3
LQTGGIHLAKRKITKIEREKMERIIHLLNQEYQKEYRCFLHYESPWQLLFATILSAQCTDERVNIVTKDLFRKYQSIEEFAGADQEELEKDIHSTGFYRNKAKNIIACANQLMIKHQGEVPQDIDELTALAGVGRKTANVIRGNIYLEPSIVVDTHVKRISKRLGFTKEEDPVKVEFDLMELLPKEQWILYNIHIIMLGRSICIARNPKCSECFLREECSYVKAADKKALNKNYKNAKKS